MSVLTQVSEIAKAWSMLDDSEKLEIIESAIDMCNTDDGFLMLQYWRKENCVGGYIRNSLANHLCVEAVSQDTLIALFGENHDYNSEDAEAILQWMNNQN